VEGGVFLKEGDTVDLVEGDGRASDWRTIAVDHPDVLTALHAGDRVALGDGGTELLVEVVDADRAVALVLTGGRLQGRPGIALPEDRFAMDTPTAEDLRLLDAVVGAGVDAVALSFVRSAADVQRLRTSIASNDGPMVMAKIETRSAVDDIDAIVGVADAVMVARGDLGIRCALEDVPHFQKRIIRTGVAYGRPVVTATQMLESMIQAPTPTRAEVTDVANAVFDGTSALMLSAETAIGHDPVLAVTTMARITVRAEQEFDHRSWGASLGRQQQSVVSGSPPSVRITAAISAAAWRAAADADAVAIIACTNTGSTARAISRFRPPVPIFAVTPSESTARQLSVAWGITPLLGERRESSDDITWFAVMKAVETGLVEPDDIVAVLVGSPLEPDPVTDMLRLVRVRDL
jgi:pyruvate kinase